MNPYELEIFHGQLNTISNVIKDSIADEMDIEVGDQVLMINGTKILDVIDYRYNVADPYVELLIQKKSGEIWDLEIEKELGEDLGISFADPLLDNQKQCSNDCLFCFIDQMPPGMRDSLYIKDDDSRLSFLQGNYITLTNLKTPDFERIISYKLSPINVSVHTTNPELRVKMLNNRFAGKIYDDLLELTKNGIVVNAQIVALPGINDGIELERTLKDLASLGDGISSVAVVPVGVTKYRDKLKNIDIFDKEKAGKLIDLVESFGIQISKSRGRKWVYASDEFYLIAKRNIPSEDYYEGYPQYENGVGLLRSFYEEALHFLRMIEPSERKGRVTLATGEYASPMFEKIKEKIQEKIPGLSIDIYTIKNNFFGNTVKVAGLLTGQDIIDQLKGLETNDIMLPRVMFRQDKYITLDDYTIEDLGNKLNSRIIPCENDGEIFIEKILEVGLHG